MWKNKLTIFSLAYFIVNTQSLPHGNYEIEKSVELFSSEEKNSSPEIDTRFATDDGNRLWYSPLLRHLPSIYSLSPTFTSFSGPENYDGSQENNNAYISFDNNKPGKRVGHRRGHPGFNSHSHRKGNSPGYGGQNFHGWGSHNHQNNPHNSYSNYNPFYPNSGSHSQYLSNHYLPQVHDHGSNTYYPNWFDHSHGSDNAHQSHNMQDLHYPTSPQYTNGPYHNDFHYTHEFHNTQFPHNSEHPSQGPNNAIQPSTTENYFPEENKPDKHKCNSSRMPGCKDDNSEEQLKPEMSTPTPTFPTQLCPFAINTENGGCNENVKTTTSVPNTQPNTTGSSTRVPDDYPDIDVRFGDEETTTTSKTTTE